MQREPSEEDDKRMVKMTYENDKRLNKRKKHMRASCQDEDQPTSTGGGAVQWL
jgi:hypothetical protein